MHQWTFQSSPTPKGGRYWLQVSFLPLAKCFNPRPPRKVGATTNPCDECGATGCFNPRPPRKVGATGFVECAQDFNRVSILAHPERWALRHVNDILIRVGMFQSSPTPKGGRYPGDACHQSATRGFQSSPTPKGGRYAVFSIYIYAHYLFQSSPTPKGGRYHTQALLALLRSGFNPRPPRKVGATWLPPHEAAPIAGFNPRPPRKVGATTARTSRRTQLQCFNPRPPRKVGATSRSRPGGPDTVVSILAHPERWALHAVPVPYLDNPRFQSSPTPKGGRYVKPATAAERCCSFNPRPPRKVGATWAGTCGKSGDNCFNPRPPRKVGATLGPPGAALALCVSILAHPERWALPGPSQLALAILLFQSSPTPKGGRYLARSRYNRRRGCFNPRPPRKVGATLDGEGCHVGRLKVSILAHPERWALPLRVFL